MTVTEYLDHLEEWYGFECMGTLIARRLAQSPRHVAVAGSMLLLAELEARAAAWILRTLEQHGRRPAPAVDLKEKVDAIVAPMLEGDWAEALAVLRVDLRRWVDELAEAESRAPQGFGAIAAHLTAHERAWLSFADSELTPGETDSIAEVRALLKSDFDCKI